MGGATTPNGRRRGPPATAPRRGRALLLSAVLALGFATAHADPVPSADAPPTPPANTRQISVLNRSRQAIDQLYISPSYADQWGEEWLGGESVDPGGLVLVDVPRSAGCNVDIQVIYANSGREERHGIDICHVIEIGFDGSSAVIQRPMTGGLHDIAVANNATRAIQQLFLSDVTTDDWGDDRLGGKAIAIGDTRSLTYRGPCGVDLRVVYDNRSAEERRDIDMCSTPLLAIHPGWTTEDNSLPKLVAAAPLPAPIIAATPAPPTSAPAPAPAAASGTVVEMIDITNRSTAPITAIMLIPQNAPASAPQTQNVLGEILARGGHVVVPFTRGATCQFTAHVQHGGSAADQDMSGLDLCRSRNITIPAHSSR